MYIFIITNPLFSIMVFLVLFLQIFGCDAPAVIWFWVFYKYHGALHQEFQFGTCITTNI